MTEAEALADFLAEQNRYHCNSIASKDPILQAHIARLAKWEKWVRATAHQPDAVREGFAEASDPAWEEMLNAIDRGTDICFARKWRERFAKLRDALAQPSPASDATSRVPLTAQTIPWRDERRQFPLYELAPDFTLKDRDPQADERLRLYRDIFAELTAKAIPSCDPTSDDPERVRYYQLPVGPLHRAAGRLGFQLFNGEQYLAEAVREIARLKGLPAADATARREDWKDDPRADERWNAGCDFAMLRLCEALQVDPHMVSWDAATETVDGDVRAVIWNILQAKMGEDWSPDAAGLANGRDAVPLCSKGTGEAHD